MNVLESAGTAGNDLLVLSAFFRADSSVIVDASRHSGFITKTKKYFSVLSQKTKE